MTQSGHFFTNSGHFFSIIKIGQGRPRYFKVQLGENIRLTKKFREISGVFWGKSGKMKTLRLYKPCFTLRWTPFWALDFLLGEIHNLVFIFRWVEQKFRCLGFGLLRKWVFQEKMCVCVCVWTWFFNPIHFLTHSSFIKPGNFRRNKASSLEVSQKSYTLWKF